ncbi:esterase/lipase family protein [Prochlorococcus sp. MIT 1223]|uniref:esterase/lipase family protein n=1 Tax=Prochlorococcus sp. MIT 1223 TaxID=3096217 RepID=UPI002A757FC9|nr:alpha/beta fold hydrolase [Prochlorococcus sp. MIT 1223]
MLRRTKIIIMVHGLWDKPNVFNRLVLRLESIGLRVLAPHLPHGLGNVSIKTLAEKLDNYICETLNEDESFDIVGFSMGGLVVRYWLQRMEGTKRTRRFFSIGTPHQGTFTAQVVPSWLLIGIAEMKRGSIFLKDLNRDVRMLYVVNPVSFFCFWDLMVFPGWEARLLIGKAYKIPVLTHKDLISNSSAIDIITQKILRNL